MKDIRNLIIAISFSFIIFLTIRTSCLTIENQSLKSKNKRLTENNNLLLCQTHSWQHPFP